MQYKNKHIFYSPDDIVRYLSGKMTAQEMHDLERAALTDPLLADSIDGFRHADTRTTTKHLDEIRATLLGSSAQTTPLEYKEKSRNLRGWRLLAAACVLGVMATGGWWLLKPTDPVLNETAQIKAIVDSTGSAIVINLQKDNVAGNVDTPSRVGNQTENAAIAKLDARKAVSQSAPIAAAPATATPTPEGLESKKIQDNTKEIAAATIHSEITDKAKAECEDNNSAEAPARAMAKVSTMRAAPMDKNYSAFGKVTDETGKPLAAVSITGPGNRNTYTKPDGSFYLPVGDSAGNISISLSGYNTHNWNYSSGKLNNIILTKKPNELNEIVIVGYGKSKTQKARMGDFNKFKKETEASNKKTLAYPEEGWAHFNQAMENDLAVDRTKPTKTIEIKFTVDENGEPTDFTIVETADELLIKKAIERIKKAKWKTKKLSKNAIVKIEIN